jgi:transcriptional regulator with PAS, ATPase and Fis domain
MDLPGALDLVFDRLNGSPGPMLASLERAMIERALQAEGGDQAAAAKRLGITKAALVKKLK